MPFLQIRLTSIKLKLVLLVVFNNIFAYSQTLIPVRENNLWGFCDTAYNNVIKPNYKEVSLFNESGFSIVMDNHSKKGVINKKGEFIIPFKNQECSFNPEYFLKENKHRSYSYYDKYSTSWSITSKDDNNANLIVTKVSDSLFWYNHKGQLSLKGTVQDKLISTYNIKGYCVKQLNLEDSSYSISIVSDKGNVVLNNLLADDIFSERIYDYRGEITEKSIYVTQKEVKTKDKTIPDGIIALYDDNGNEILSYDMKITGVRDIFELPNKDVVAFLFKRTDGGNDCDPETFFGIYNITQKEFELPIKFNSIEVNDIKYLDRTRERFNSEELNNLNQKFLSLVNSDTIFESLDEYQNIFKYSTQNFLDFEEKLIVAQENKKVNFYNTDLTYLSSFELFDLKNEIEQIIVKHNKKAVVLDFETGGDEPGYVFLNDKNRIIYSTPIEKRGIKHQVIRYFPNGKKILVDNKMKVIFDKGFSNVEYLSVKSENDFILFKDENNKKALVDSNGTIVLDYKYYEIEVLQTSNGVPLVVAADNKEIVVLNLNGDRLISSQNELSYYYIDNYLFFKETKQSFDSNTGFVVNETIATYDSSGKKY